MEPNSPEKNNSNFERDSITKLNVPKRTDHSIEIFNIQDIMLQKEKNTEDNRKRKREKQQQWNLRRIEEKTQRKLRKVFKI